MKEQNTPWYELLDHLIGSTGLSRPQVAQRAGVNTKTITSWLRGDVKSPRDWRPLARVLRAINASTAEANQILQGTGHAAVHQLVARASVKDRELLAGWLKPDVPFMPPARLTINLVGRTAEMAGAVNALRQQRRCVLLGMAGVGKTTLAVELAHQLRHDYPDGVFWGDLRIGVADAVLESWGQACGVAIERLADFSSRAAAMRAVFARKQALIILDDVVDSRPATQMIPSQNLNCAVLVTTRSADVAHALTRLQPGTEIRLTPMSRRHSLDLLAGILGKEVVDEAANAAGRVAALLGDMPLALHICAALCLDTGLSLRDMAVLLRNQRTRLDHLQLEEKPLVRLAFEQSWALLNEKMRQGFAILAVFAGRLFDISAYAAVAGLPEPEATLILTRLVRRSLLTMDRTANESEHGRFYRQHTLLAAYAGEKLADADPAWQRFSHYYGRLVSKPEWWRAAPPETWANVMAGMAAAHRQQDWPRLLNYSTNLAEAWRRRGLYSLAREGYGWALTAAQETADPLAEADIRLEWGRAYLEQSAYEPSRMQLNGALSLYAEHQQTAGIAATLDQLSRVDLEQSNHDAAEAAIQQAYQAYQQVEDVVGMGRALYRLGNISYYRGDYERAGTLAADAIRSQQNAGDDVGLLRSHMLSANICTQLGQIDAAESHCRVAEQILAQVNDRAEQAVYYYTYAEVHRHQQAFPAAQSYGQQALDLFREMADSSSEANALLLLAAIEISWNDAEPSRQLFEAGLAYCREGLMASQEVGYEIGRAFLLLMNGRLLAQKGDLAEACQVWSMGLDLAQALRHEWLPQRLQELIDDYHCTESQLRTPQSVVYPAGLS